MTNRYCLQHIILKAMIPNASSPKCMHCSVLHNYRNKYSLPFSHQQLFCTIYSASISVSHSSRFTLVGITTPLQVSTSQHCASSAHSVCIRFRHPAALLPVSAYQSAPVVTSHATLALLGWFGGTSTLNCRPGSFSVAAERREREPLACRQEHGMEGGHVSMPAV